MRPLSARAFKRGLLPYAAAATAALALPAVAAAGGQQGGAADPGTTLQGPVFQTATLSGDNTVTACADRPLMTVNDPQQSILSPTGDALNTALSLGGSISRNITNGLDLSGLLGGLANNKLVTGDSAGGLFALIPANDVENKATNLFGLGGSVGALVNELNPNTISTELHGYIPDNQFPDSQNSVTIDPENNKCVVLNYVPAGGSNPLSSYLAGFTNLSIEHGAVTDLRGTPNDYTQTLKLGGTQIAARAALPGETIAAKLVSAVPRSATNSIDFNFSAPVDPSFLLDKTGPDHAHRYSFITPSGEVVHGENLPGTSPQVLNSGTC